MKPHAVEIGERYADDSGWERLVAINMQTGILEIQLQGSRLCGHPREALWLIGALERALATVAEESHRIAYSRAIRAEARLAKIKEANDRGATYEEIAAILEEPQE